MSKYTPRDKESRKLYYHRVEKHNPTTVKRMRANTKRWRKKYPDRHLLLRCRARARKQDLVFELGLSDFIIPKVCPLLEIPIDFSDRDHAASIDRIDNSKGYIKGNVWIISFKANRMKNTASLSELKVFAKNILKKDIGQ